MNGGVDVYITAYPEYNCGNTTGCWTIFGGTSAATPQTAALVALVNAARTAAGKGAHRHIDYHVEVERHFYSVPHQLIGDHVDARVTARTVEIIVHGRRVASHARSVVRAGHTTVNKHMPSAPRRHAA